MSGVCSASDAGAVPLGLSGAYVYSAAAKAQAELLDDTPAGDVAALLAAKDSGTGWPASWRAGSDPCTDSWQGVTCSAGRVTEM